MQHPRHGNRGSITLLFRWPCRGKHRSESCRSYRNTPMPGQGWTASWSTLKSQQAKYYALQACTHKHCAARDASHSAHAYPRRLLPAQDIT